MVGSSSSGAAAVVDGSSSGAPGEDVSADSAVRERAEVGDDPFETWGERRGVSGEAVPFPPDGGPSEGGPAESSDDDPFETLGRLRNESGEAVPIAPVRSVGSADDPFEALGKRRSASGEAVPLAKSARRRDASGEALPLDLADGRDDAPVAADPFEERQRRSRADRPRAGRFGAGRSGGDRSGERRSGADRSGGRWRGAYRDRDVDPDGEAAKPVDPVKEQRNATDICYALLTARARTRVELKDALLRKGIRAETAELVLGKFDRAGLIDDAAFAEVWVRSRHTYQGLGRRALVQELRRKGVADEVVAEAVAAVDDEAEQERARELVRKKLRAMSNLDDQTKIRRLVGALARKGYAEGMAYRVVREELRAAEIESPLDEYLPD